MIEIFDTIIQKPIINLTIWVYNMTGSDFGLAVIFLTLLIRMAIFPLTLKITRSQLAMSRLAPKLKALKEKHKGDQVAQGNATMQLYKEEGVNPFAGCFSMLVQLPIIIALYRTFSLLSQSQGLDKLYGFVYNPTVINTVFLGLLNLAGSNKILAVLAGVAQFLQSKKMHEIQKPQESDNPAQGAINKQMLYFFPVMIVVISWNLPAALSLYWIFTALISMAEQIIIQKKFAK